jgi:hypothetical protein
MQPALIPAAEDGMFKLLAAIDCQRQFDDQYYTGQVDEQSARWLAGCAVVGDSEHDTDDVECDVDVVAIDEQDPSLSDAMVLARCEYQNKFEATMAAAAAAAAAADGVSAAAMPWQARPSPGANSRSPPLSLPYGVRTWSGRPYTVGPMGTASPYGFHSRGMLSTANRMKRQVDGEWTPGDDERPVRRNDRLGKPSNTKLQRVLPRVYPQVPLPPGGMSHAPGTAVPSDGTDAASVPAGAESDPSGGVYPAGDDDSSGSMSVARRRRGKRLKAVGPLHCKYCPYVSDSANNILRHERSHTGESARVCSVCVCVCVCACVHWEFLGFRLGSHVAIPRARLHRCYGLFHRRSVLPLHVAPPFSHQSVLLWRPALGDPLIPGCAATLSPCCDRRWASRDLGIFLVPCVSVLIAAAPI